MNRRRGWSSTVPGLLLAAALVAAACGSDSSDDAARRERANAATTAVATTAAAPTTAEVETTAAPPTAVPTTAVPDTAVSTTAVPDTAVPDTAAPPAVDPDSWEARLAEAGLSTVEPGPPADPVCPARVDPLERTLDFSGPFPRCIEPDVAYEATFVTNFGEVVVALDGERVPNALNAFIVLAEYGYYDDTAIMRIAPSIDIIQGGAPHTQDNADDGAGFPIPDEGGDFVEDGRSVTGPFTYKPGQLVLARTAAVDGSGPQFFFTTGPNASLLDAGTGVAGAGSYLVLGDVSMGLDVLVEIQSLSDPADFMGRPTEMVIVETVDITPSLLDVDQAALFCEAGTTIDGLGSRYTTSEEAETLFRALESWSDQLWAYAPDDLLDQAELLHAFYSLLLAEGEDVDFSIFVLETDSFIDRVYDGLGIEDADDFADIRARIADDC